MKNVAMCLVRFLEKPGAHRVEMRAIGAGAVNQAVKSIACARGILKLRGLDLCVRIGFCSAGSEEWGQEKTAMRFETAISRGRGGCDG